MTGELSNAYAGSLLELSDRLASMATAREDQAVTLGARLCRQRALTPVQIVDALTPAAARVRRLRRSAEVAARSANEVR